MEPLLHIFPRWIRSWAAVEGQIARSNIGIFPGKFERFESEFQAVCIQQDLANLFVACHRIFENDVFAFSVQAIFLGDLHGVKENFIAVCRQIFLSCL